MTDRFNKEDSTDGNKNFF